jgi:hypothetical protein
MNEIEDICKSIRKLQVDIILFLHSHPGSSYYKKSGSSPYVVLDESLGNRTLVEDALHQLLVDKYVYYGNQQISGIAHKYIPNADVYLTRSCIASLWRLFLEDKGIDI